MVTKRKVSAAIKNLLIAPDVTHPVTMEQLGRIFEELKFPLSEE